MSSTKKVGACLAQLITSATQGNEAYTGQAATETAAGLKSLTNSIRGVAANIQDKTQQEK